MASARKVSQRHLEQPAKPSVPAVQEPAGEKTGIHDPGTTLGVAPPESEVMQKPEKE